MFNLPLPGPTSDPMISADGSTRYPNPGKTCFSCTPPDLHSREWKPDPDSPSRERTLVLCFDGTGDSFDEDNSNVVQFLAMLRKDDPTKQLVYYQAGIGTYTSNVLKTPIIERVTKLRNKMFARDLHEHVKDGYKFLMQNYRFGDQICIFGFSRGAFTAHALATMVQKIGLLPASNLEQLPFAFAMYERDDKKGLDLSIQFKRTFSIDARIKFLGLWDTVQSVGWNKKRVPLCASSNAIAHVRHALALDERRVKFTPSFCTDKTPKDQKMGPKIRQCESYLNDPHLYVQDTDVEEVFFTGAHCDVGGGSVRNGERHSLSRIPLRWMIRECFKVDTGIIFDAHMLKNEVGLDVNSILEAPPPHRPATFQLDMPKPEGGALQQIPATIISALYSPYSWIRGKPSDVNSPEDESPPVQPLPTSENESQEELNDAISQIHDQLKKYAHWRVMEWIPFIVERQHGLGGIWVWNRGKGRVVYHETVKRGMKVHRSVKTRMLARAIKGEKQYSPEIRREIDGEVRHLTREEWLADKPAYFVWVD